MNNGYEEFLAFEKDADADVAKIALWRHPIRSILSLIYLSADSQYVGARFDRKGHRDSEVGTAMITRMSFVTQFFGQCSREIGADIDDVLSVVDQQFQFEIEQVLGYAHFCEIMPLVRRGFFSVERQTTKFVLDHPNDEFMRHEENDILMSEMALPHDLRPPPDLIDNCKRMIKAWPHIAGEDLIKVLKSAYDHYIENVFEFPLLSDAAFKEGFGFARSDFIQIRAALMSYADFCLGMAGAAELLSMQAFTNPRREKLQREVREWVAPLLDRNHIIGTVAGLCGVPPNTAERIIDLFTIDLNQVGKSAAGEGYFPPFTRIGDALLFSPHALKRTMPERNLLYIL